MILAWDIKLYPQKQRSKQRQKKTKSKGQEWWHMPLILAVRMNEFEASFVYLESSRLAKCKIQALTPRKEEGEGK